MFLVCQLFSNKVDVFSQHGQYCRHLLLVAQNLVVGIPTADERLKEIRHLIVDTCQNVQQVVCCMILTQHFTQCADKHGSMPAAERVIT